MSSTLLYGSYGFVGELVAHEARDRGMELILSGRDRDALTAQTDELDAPARRFDLTDPATIADALEDVDCVLNCAGPFSNTAESLVDGCVRSGTDYVDITGEIPVIERLERWGPQAANADITLLPSAGFSSVPMDCLAAHLHERLPEATALALAVNAVRPPSVGSIVTAIEGIEDGSAIRRDGHLESVPAGWRTRTIDFGSGRQPAVTMPLGDVSTAHYTTGIPDIDVYAVVPQPARTLLKAHRYVAPILATRPVRWLSKRIALLVRNGPAVWSRHLGSASLWGEARADGDRVVSRLETPDPYEVTVDAAVTTTQRVLAGDAENGYQTPAGAFGPEFVLDLDGVDGFDDGPIRETPHRASTP